MVSDVLDSVADEDDPYALLSARDEADEELAVVRVAPDIKLTTASAAAWMADDCRQPDWGTGSLAVSPSA